MSFHYFFLVELPIVVIIIPISKHEALLSHHKTVGSLSFDLLPDPLAVPNL